MAKLTTEDRNRLVECLLRCLDFTNIHTRHAILVGANLGSIAEKIDLEGTSQIVATKIIRSLEAYGQIPGDTDEALGRFCKILLKMDLVGDIEQEYLRNILIKYQLTLSEK